MRLGGLYSGYRGGPGTRTEISTYSNHCILLSNTVLCYEHGRVLQDEQVEITRCFEIVNKFTYGIFNNNVITRVCTCMFAYMYAGRHESAMYFQ